MNRSNSTLAMLAVTGLTILGVVLAFSIPSSVFPEITFNRAIIMADTGDLPPEQMLVTVTRPIEDTAYGVIGVSLVRSTTTRGSSEIDVTFSEGVDPTSSFQLLNAALGEVRSRLPDGKCCNRRGKGVLCCARRCWPSATRRGRCSTLMPTSSTNVPPARVEPNRDASVISPWTR